MGKQMQSQTLPPIPRDPNEPAHLALAADALVNGWTRERVITALLSRIQRDEHYLAYRRACNRRTRYDDDVTADLNALALAAVWLDEAKTPTLPTTHTTTKK